ncbi:unnamed protein product [Prorocentrum cordatum]|uniref:Uncharacterized protein n=1 Tax=Prorocentrum cordatum TaxID=2364126 RepID=A0ABN9XBS8_9DINO|nr:unnamed protein product [Polarella glacialis]
MRSAVVRQLHIDVKFLVDHDITGYSMKLLIKHDPTAPAGTCDVKEDVEVRPLSKTQGRSVFERYQWGIRAKNASAGRAAERAIFKFKIENFLALGGHAVSGWAGFSSGEERVLNVQEIGASIRLPHVWKKLLDTPDMRRLKKCKNLVDSPEEAHRLGAMCWTGCGETSRTVCDELDDKAMDKAGTHFVKLVEYDFAGDWAKGHSLACDGFTNFGRHIRRALCGLTNRHPNYDDMESLGQRLKVDAIPEPFQSQIPGHEIERAFHANSLAGADSDLAVYLNFFLPTHKVPFVLKRLAVMTYYDFAQLPLPVDLLPSEEYARRLSRFVSAWVTSPSSKEWEDNMCPKLKRAGCLHIGGDHWQPDDPELTRVPEKPAFEDDDDDPSSGHRNSLGVLLGGALPALWFAAICSGPLWHAPA